MHGFMYVCIYVCIHTVYSFYFIHCVYLYLYTGITLVLQSNKHSLTSIKLISSTYISNQLIYNIVDICVYIKEIVLHAMEGCTLTRAGICSIYSILS